MPSDAVSATHDIPVGDSDAPTLGALREAYVAAIAATDEAGRAYNETIGRRNSRKYERGVARWAHEAAILQERKAGRAFLDLLTYLDPACHVCGCTDRDPCGEGCWWVASDGQPLCSSCADDRGIDGLELMMEAEAVAP